MKVKLNNNVSDFQISLSQMKNPTSSCEMFLYKFEEALCLSSIHFHPRNW